MYEKYLEQFEEAGKVRNLKERSINCYKNYVSYFLKYQGKFEFLDSGYPECRLKLTNWEVTAMFRRMVPAACFCLCI